MPDPALDAVAATADLKARMQALLDEARATYPGGPRTPDDTWWVPASLGGTAPTLEEAEATVARGGPQEKAARRRARRPRSAPPPRLRPMVSLRRTKDAPPKKGAGSGAPAKPKAPRRRPRQADPAVAFTATRKADPRMPLLVLAALLGAGRSSPSWSAWSSAAWSSCCRSASPSA